MRSVLLFLACLVIIVGVLGISVYVLLTTGTYWTIRNKKYIKQNRNALKGNIVFYGDSITEFYHLDKYYSKECILYNRGIGGDTTDGLLKRMDSNVVCLNPKRVFLMIGTNDLQKKDAEYVLKNYKVLLDSFKKKLPECEVIVESLYPVNDSLNLFVKERNKEIIKINKGLVKLVKEYNYLYIDIYSHLLDEEGKLKREYTIDGLHLSDSGYVVVTSLLRDYVEEE